MRKNKKTLEAIIGVAAVPLIALVLYVTGIGCPIKFATGISCPGCGMTRAWLSALSLRFDLALAYHPLFWLLPLVIALVTFRKRISPRLYTGLLWTCIILLLGVWIARLALPMDSGVLFSSPLHEDVVSIGPPKWLQFVQHVLARTVC